MLRVSLESSDLTSSTPSAKGRGLPEITKLGKLIQEGSYYLYYTLASRRTNVATIGTYFRTNEHYRAKVLSKYRKCETAKFEGIRGLTDEKCRK